MKKDYDHAVGKFVSVKKNRGRAGEGGRKKGVSHNYPSNRSKNGVNKSRKAATDKKINARPEQKRKRRESGRANYRK